MRRQAADLEQRLAQERRRGADQVAPVRWRASTHELWELGELRAEVARLRRQPQPQAAAREHEPIAWRRGGREQQAEPKGGHGEGRSHLDLLGQAWQGARTFAAAAGRLMFCGTAGRRQRRRAQLPRPPPVGDGPDGGPSD